MLAAVDEGGSVYILKWIDREVKPIIVTPLLKGQQLVMPCPASQWEHPIQEGQLGGEMTCSTPGCGLRRIAGKV